MNEGRRITDEVAARVTGICDVWGTRGAPGDGILAQTCHELAPVLREPVLRRALARFSEGYTPTFPTSPRSLSQLIDHTVLDALVRPDDVVRACREAAEWRFATVSVNSRFVALAVRSLEDMDVGVCASIAFPFGAMSTETKVAEARSAVWDGAAEIDMVLPIGLLKARCYQEIFADILYVRQAVEPPARLRVVLETSLLTTGEMVDGAFLATAAGADAIKTSTGFLGPGPSPADIRLLRQVIGGGMGIKIEGPIHTWDGAGCFLSAGATRIASHSGTKIMRSFLASRRLDGRERQHEGAPIAHYGRT